MPESFYKNHKEILKKAQATIESRAYWTPYPESPRAYGEDAPKEGEAAFEDRLGKRFALDQAADSWSTGGETSAYGRDLGVSYPVVPVTAVLDAAEIASNEWASVSIKHRAGVCLEILDRLSRNSFEMAHAVMQTTGQSFLMAFQAGGPHALDRGLEAVAYGFGALTRLPRKMEWEKPQGKRDPLVISKTWRIRPAGIAVTIGVSTFPTWNGYPGILASLVTGNPVILKPHPATILPLALFVETARAVLADADLDPNTVQLAVDTAAAPIAKDLVMDPRVKLVDYTGGSSFGDWLEANVGHAEVFTEKAGVNSVIIDSAEDLKGVFRNLSVSMTMYGGQMCTTPQNVYVPREGIHVAGEHVGYDEVASGLAGAIEGLLSDDDRASDILGAIKDRAALDRMDEAADGHAVLLGSREVANPQFPDAVVRTPVIIGVDGVDKEAYMREMFGPVIYVIATDSTQDSLELATESALRHGAITWLVYSSNPEVQDLAEDAAVDAGVSVAFNLTGGLLVNQSAAFSDFHVTGANPAGNASLTDPAFIAKRFRVVGVRKPA
ncbi:MAG: phenylacetic acid degradation protein PaaN [bacterium]|nr:phenylacetic acid degradation protein PaaN [bacterium]